jgi:GxxExxY protein
MNENELAKIVVDCCFKIHKLVGPGLLESAYERLLAFEFRARGIPFVRQKLIGISYDGLRLDFGFRADFVVDEKLIVEVKSIETLGPVHFKQLLTYLRFADPHLGLLANFNQALIKEGIRRIVNNLQEPDRSF